MADKDVIQSPAGEFVMFASDDGTVRITCRFEHETLWLSQAAIASLYQVTLKLLLSILKLFTKKVSLNKKQLVRLTYKFSKKVSARSIATHFTIACPSFSPSAIASDPREVHSSASGPPKRSRSTWLKASLWTTSA